MKLMEERSHKVPKKHDTKPAEKVQTKQENKDNLNKKLDDAFGAFPLSSDSEDEEEDDFYD